MENRHEKTVGLLRDLRDCLEKERKCLIEVNVSDLWAVMEEKQGLLQAMEDLRPLPEKTRNGEEGGERDASAPPPAPALRSEMDHLKEEIRFRSRENAEFIRGSMAVFDELISRIAGVVKDHQTYKPQGLGTRAPRHSIYRRKV
jgi:flagellar biosynthesis/type III secretory pathway chaperone